MTRQQFNLAFAALINAFSSDRITDQSQDIYFQLLQEIPEDMWEEGIKKCLRECRFFPTIHELGNACVGEHYTRPKYNPWAYCGDPVKLTWEQGLKRIISEREGKQPQIEAPIEMLAQKAVNRRGTFPRGTGGQG